MIQPITQNNYTYTQALCSQADILYTLLDQTSAEKKEKDLLGFAHNEYQIMISKYIKNFKSVIENR